MILASSIRIMIHYKLKHWFRTEVQSDNLWHLGQIIGFKVGALKYALKVHLGICADYTLVWLFCAPGVWGPYYGPFDMGWSI